MPDTNTGVRLVLERWKRYKNPMQDATPLPAIVLKDLQKYYPPPRTGIRAYVQPFERATRPALQGVTFEVQEGEAVALLGANGAGKSTILRILATLLIPTRGQAFVSGHDTAKDPRAVRRKLGYHAGSDQGFYPRLTGRQNLLFFGQLNHLTRAQAQNRIAELGKNSPDGRAGSAGAYAVFGHHAAPKPGQSIAPQAHGVTARRAYAQSGRHCRGGIPAFSGEGSFAWRKNFLALRFARALGN
jgi:hypothetical protein